MPEEIMHLGELVWNCEVPSLYVTAEVQVSYRLPNLQWITCLAALDVWTNFAVYDWGHIPTGQRLGTLYPMAGDQPVLPDHALDQATCSYPRWYTFILTNSMAEPQPAPAFRNFRIWSGGASALLCQVGDIIHSYTAPRPLLNLAGEPAAWYNGVLTLQIPEPSRTLLPRMDVIPSPQSERAKYLDIPTLPLFPNSFLYPQFTQGFALQWNAVAGVHPGRYSNEMLYYSVESH